VLDDANDGLQRLACLFRREAGAGQVAVRDVMVAVGDVVGAVFLLAELRGEALVGEALECCLPGEGDDFDGELENGAEDGDELAGVDRDEELVGADLDELFAEECATVALDEMKGAFLDFVRAVNGEVEPGGVDEVRHRDVEGESLAMRGLGGGDGFDAETLGDAATDLVDDEGGGGAGAETDGHAVLDLGGGPLGGFLLGELLG